MVAFPLWKSMRKNGQQYSFLKLFEKLSKIYFFQLLANTYKQNKNIMIGFNLWQVPRVWIQLLYAKFEKIMVKIVKYRNENFSSMTVLSVDIFYNILIDAIKKWL